jgi:GT2 family glycosyltransferase
MNVFVVIATREREALLARTLACLAECRRPEGFAGTLVVENGRRAGTERVVRNAPASLDVRYLFEPAGNKSKALNAALAQVDDGLVVFLDDDIRAGPDLLEVYARAARRAGAGQFFGGPVEPEYEEAPPAWLLEFLPKSARGWRPRDPADVKRHPLFLGFNWAAFATDLRGVGGFSEHLGPGSDAGMGDEREMQLRMVAAGLEAEYVPQALVHHWVPRDRCSPQWALERAYRHGVGRGLLTPEDRETLTIAGYPLALISQTMGRWWRFQVRRLGGDRARQFSAQVKYHRQRGILRGAMLRRGRAPVAGSHA